MNKKYLLIFTLMPLLSFGQSQISGGIKSGIGFIEFDWPYGPLHKSEYYYFMGPALGYDLRFTKTIKSWLKWGVELGHYNSKNETSISYENISEAYPNVNFSMELVRIGYETNITYVAGLLQFYPLKRRKLYLNLMPGFNLSNQGEYIAIDDNPYIAAKSNAGSFLKSLNDFNLRRTHVFSLFAGIGKEYNIKDSNLGYRFEVSYCFLSKSNFQIIDFTMDFSLPDVKLNYLMTNICVFYKIP